MGFEQRVKIESNKILNVSSVLLRSETVIWVYSLNNTGLLLPHHRKKQPFHQAVSDK